MRLPTPIPSSLVLLIILGVLVLCAECALSTAGALSSGRYTLSNVKKLSSNMYIDTYTKTVIETRYCYEYIYGEEALLIWNGSYSYDNKIVFLDSGSSCEVKAVH